MEAQELRIGNYLHDAKGKLAIVEGLSKDNIKAYSGTVTPLPLKPIPLTEEWLLKFGFEKALNGYWDASENWCVRENKLYVEAQTYLSKVDFVHELQNLFYALCGYELQLKDTQITK